MRIEGDEPVPYLNTITPWPHQPVAIDKILSAINLRRIKRLLVTSPTGGGKTFIMAKVIWACLTEDWGVSLFANRKMLIDQMGRAFSSYGVSHSFRAASHDSVGNPYSRLQITSLQTEYSRLVKRGSCEPHDSRIIIVDEAHVNENASSHAVYDRYLERGAMKIGFTATPLGLDGCYDELIQAGTVSELIACGALVPAVHYGCTEPCLKNIRKVPWGEDFSENEQKKVMMVPGIHGYVIDHFRRLNPHGLPSLGFAPGVPESVGFAQAFLKAGISAAHIDGERIWRDGNEYASTEDSRAHLLELSRTGKVRCIWNRFVLREAVDMPWLRHGILATVFGSLQSFLQSGGRFLRACLPVGKRSVTLQDHGGNWHRHGSLNTDRVWRLRDTDRLLAQLRHDRMTGDDGDPPEPEPFLCPSCKAVVKLRGSVVGRTVHCVTCGYEFDFTRRSRPVFQSDGELVEHPGAIFERKRVETRPDSHKKWKSMFWRARKDGTMTFNQAAGLFWRENGYHPPRDLPLMPFETIDWYMPVAKVAFQSLRPEEK